MTSQVSSDNSSLGNISTVSSEDCFVYDSLAVKVSRVTAYCFIILVSVIGNSLLVYIVATERRVQKTLNYFILNMAVADLLITFYMPRAITLAYAGYEWQVDGRAGMAFCKLTVLFHETGVAVSNFTVVAISLDRFFSVVFPLKTFTTKRVCAIINCSIWFVAISLRIPMVFAVKTMIKHGMLSCFLNLDEALGPGAQKGYYYFTLIVLFSIPLAVIIILYSCIFISIKRRKNPGDPEFAPNEHRAHRNRSMKTRVLRAVSIVVAAYILCWMLYFIGLILYSYKISVSCNFQFFKLFLAHFNSALNPCLFFTFNENIRKSLKGIFSRFSWCSRCGCSSPLPSARNL